MDIVISILLSATILPVIFANPQGVRHNSYGDTFYNAGQPHPQQDYKYKEVIMYLRPSEIQLLKSQGIIADVSQEYYESQNNQGDPAIYHKKEVGHKTGFNSDRNRNDYTGRYQVVEPNTEQYKPYTMPHTTYFNPNQSVENSANPNDVRLVDPYNNEQTQTTINNNHLNQKYQLVPYKYDSEIMDHLNILKHLNEAQIQFPEQSKDQVYQPSNTNSLFTEIRNTTHPLISSKQQHKLDYLNDLQHILHLKQQALAKAKAIANSPPILVSEETTLTKYTPEERLQLNPKSLLPSPQHVGGIRPLYPSDVKVIRPQPILRNKKYKG